MYDVSWLYPGNEESSHLTECRCVNRVAGMCWRGGGPRPQEVGRAYVPAFQWHFTPRSILGSGMSVACGGVCGVQRVARTWCSCGPCGPSPWRSQETMPGQPEWPRRASPSTTPVHAWSFKWRDLGRVVIALHELLILPKVGQCLETLRMMRRSLHQI